MASKKQAPRAPASRAALRELQKGSPAPLPDAYLRYLSESNGGEGKLGVAPGWIAFWPAEEVLASNAGYSVEEFLPGFLGFASSGGGDMFAFDLRSGEPYAVVCVPFVPMDVDEVTVIAKSFDDFRRFLQL